MSRGKILCIDDEELGLRVRKMMLLSAGFEAITASSGREGLKLLSESHFDVVVLDYSMPEMNGGEIAEQIRLRHPGVAIVLLSAYVTLPEEDVQRVDAYITKGEAPEALLAVVTDLIEKGRIRA